jgi:hypothetical protein
MDHSEPSLKHAPAPSKDDNVVHLRDYRPGSTRPARASSESDDVVLISLPPPIIGVVIAAAGLVLMFSLQNGWPFWIGACAIIFGLVLAMVLRTIVRIEERCGIARRGSWWRPWNVR